jgi:chemotaxis protein histidine kinase CheA
MFQTVSRWLSVTLRKLRGGRIIKTIKMNPETLKTIKTVTIQILVWLKKVFDLTATWVTQLSWWKFLLFSMVVLFFGGILQDSLFSPNEETKVVVHPKKHSKHSTATERNFSDGDTDIKIDANGIHITSNKPMPSSDDMQKEKDQAQKDADQAQKDKDEEQKQKDEEAKASQENGDDGNMDAKSEDSMPSQKAPVAPMAPKAPKAPPAAKAPQVPGRADIHINLPPEIGKEVGDAIDEAVDDAAEQRVETLKESNSKWFMNFVVLLLAFLFAIKALMGGKKRAEAAATAAQANAEREALQRQVTEAKMQMMQAQVEPHFLFNTLASVEYLIETNPPRASAMQRSLIQYLRAVLPQMRETSSVTNLGREADMVRAYLDLLKMRMEERLHVEFQVPEGLRSAAFPPMMLQSLVENAIKHGLEEKEDGGTLRVAAEVAHNKLRVIVTDDGLGFGAIPSKGTGLGLQSIRERLKLLHGQNGQLIITPNTPSGVISTIEVPYQLAI